MPDYVISARQSLGTVQLPGGSADSQLALAARIRAEAAAAATEGDVVATAADAVAVEAARVEVSTNRGLVAADRVQTGLDAATATAGAGTATTRAGEAAASAGIATDAAAAALADRLLAEGSAADSAADRVQTGLDAAAAALSALNAASSLSLSASYTTKALADAAIGSITEGHSVEVTNDSTSALNGIWAKRSGVLVQTSTYTVAALGIRQTTTEGQIDALDLGTQTSLVDLLIVTDATSGYSWLRAGERHLMVAGLDIRRPATGGWTLGGPNGVVLNVPETGIVDVVGGRVDDLTVEGGVLVLQDANGDALVFRVDAADGALRLRGYDALTAIADFSEAEYQALDAEAAAYSDAVTRRTVA